MEPLKTLSDSGMLMVDSKAARPFLSNATHQGRRLPPVPAAGYLDANSAIRASEASPVPSLARSLVRPPQHGLHRAMPLRQPDLVHGEAVARQEQGVAALAFRPYPGIASAGGSHSSTRFPSGSITHPNLP